VNVKTQRILLLVIILITIGVYARTLKFGFYPNLDDGKLILNNNVVTHSENHKSEIFTGFVYGLYHPFTTLSFIVDYKVWGTNAFGYRLTNLLFHLFNIVLVFVFLQALFKNAFISLLSASVFALHPTHLESVIWVSERKDVLYTFFFLLSIVLYLRENQHKTLNTILVLLFFLASLLSKPSAVVLPVTLVLIDWYHEKPFVKSILSKLHLFTLSLIFGIINIKAQNVINFIQPVYESYSLIQKISLPVYALTNYFIKLFLPIKLAAKNLYPRIIDGDIQLVYYMGWLGLFVMAGLVYYFRKSRMFLFGLAFFFITIILLIKILPTGNDIVSNRYTYVAYIGLTIAFGALLLQFLKQNWKGFPILILSFTIVMGFSSFSNTKYWTDEVAIWGRVAEKEPDLVLAWHQMGKACFDKNDIQKAMQFYQRSIEVDSFFYPGYIGRGLCYYYSQKNNKSLADFTRAIQIDSLQPDGYYNRGNLYLKMGQYQLAINDLNKTKQLDNENVESIYYLAIAESKIQQYNQAIF
jgi:hypothetical protein